MNKIELFVYNRVKNNYIVKNLVRNIYQGFYDLLPNYESRFITVPIVKENCYFGFHDLNPFSEDNSKILSNKLTIPLRMPTQNDLLDVGYWGGREFSSWNKLGETHAWNYHKGCRLQWLPKERCIFNVERNGILRSEICDLDSSYTIIHWPIDTASHDGTVATSFSYERLQKMMPGYGYLFPDADSCINSPVSEGTGLYLVNLNNNTRDMVIDLKTLSLFHHEKSMDSAYHFVTHTEFSYDDRYISFLHRWYDGVNRHTRLIVYDRTTKEMYASPTTGMVSHYAWNRKGGIIAYCRVNDIDSHVYFYNYKMEKYKRCGYPKLNSDGHHHFIYNDNFVVDTYPNKYRHAMLYKVNVNTDDVTLLADVRSFKKFASPSPDMHWACDLHPRCSEDGTLISFDSVFTGKRSLCIMKLPKNNSGITKR